MEMPNEPLEIYRGGLKVEYKGVIVSGKGRIFVSWQPSLETWFELQYCDECGLKFPNALTSGDAVGLFLETNPNQSKNYLEVAGIPEHIARRQKYLFPAKGIIREINESHIDPCNLVGNIILPHPTAKCDSIKFYITNFKNSSDFNHLCWAEEEWTVKIDAIENIETLLRRVNGVGGFIITHVGVLKHTDGSIFVLPEGTQYLQALFFLLSFMRGIWCGPTLSCGVESYNIVWQEEISNQLTPWTYHRGWVGEFSLAGTAELFKNFMHAWRNKRKQGALKNIIQWYVEANLNAGGMEGSIILVHSALELLANMNGYNGSIIEIIRELIKDLKISPSLTEKQINLRQVYDDSKYELKKNGEPDKWDGPSILTELRNAIVHPKSNRNKHRPPLEKVPREAREEALDLGLWYLELCILKKLDYKCEYFNRIDIAFEKVPWA